MLWGFPVGKCDLDSYEKDTKYKPGGKTKYTKEREGFDLSQQYKSNHARLMIASML